MRPFFALFLFSVFILTYAKAQDTLPGFTASIKSNGKVLISWRNAYPAINQISIQRSSDSLRNFTTLITVPDPRIPENGFVDSKPNGAKMYYRIFILFPNSKYMFTKSRRAVTETAEQPMVVIKPAVKEKPKSTNQKAQAMPKEIGGIVNALVTGFHLCLPMTPDSSNPLRPANGFLDSRQCLTGAGSNIVYF